MPIDYTTPLTPREAVRNYDQRSTRSSVDTAPGVPPKPQLMPQGPSSYGTTSVSAPSTSDYVRRFSNEYARQPNLSQKVVYNAVGTTPERYAQLHPDKSRNGPALNNIERAIDYIAPLAKKATDPAALAASYATGGTASVLATGAALGAADSYADQRLRGRPVSLRKIATNAFTEAAGGGLGDAAVPGGSTHGGGSPLRQALSFGLETLGRPIASSMVGGPLGDAAAAGLDTASAYARRYFNPLSEAQAKQ